MEKLLENLDKMVWRDIERLSEEEIEKLEKELEIKFLKEDRKYLKAYNCGKGLNVYIKINDIIFKIDICAFNLKYLTKNINNFFKEGKKGYFNERKLVPLVINTEWVTKNDEIEGIFNNLIVCEYKQNNNFYEIIYIRYYKKLRDNLETVKYEYDFIKESVIEKKIGEKLTDIFEYMYVDKDMEVEIEKITEIFEEEATKEEINEFQEKIGLKFPKKYEELLNKAREKGVEIYPEKFKDKVPENIIDTGFYMSLNEIISTYEIYIDYHKPYPKKLIPIKECGGGDNICLDYRGKMNTTLKEPKITYYVHDEVGNRRFIHLADSYDEFLDMIELDKEEIEEREREIRESYFYGEQPLED